MKKIFGFALAIVVSLQISVPVLARDPQPSDFPELINYPLVFSFMRDVLERHLIHNNFDDQVFRGIYPNLIESYDPKGLLFLKSEIESYKKIDDATIREYKKQFLSEGIDSSFSHIFLIYQARVERLQRALKALEMSPNTIVERAAILKKTRKFNSEPPANEEEQMDRLVQYAASNFLARERNGLSKDDAVQMTFIDLNRMMSDRSRNTLGTLPEHVLQAFMASLDPHSAYMNTREWRDYSERSRNNMVGIGILFTEGPHGLLINGVLKGAPAEKAGIQSGDLITKVDDVPLPMATLAEATDRIQGTKGTQVQLTIVRGGQTLQKMVLRLPLDRAPERVKSEIRLTTQGKVGVLGFDGFFRDVSGELRKRIEDFKKDGVQGVVLDLRGNPGGDLLEALRVAGLFIKPGPIAEAADAAQTEMYPNQKLDVITWNVWTGPLVVLISYGSASASEIVSGTLKDYGRAVIVGTEQTYGKGTVQGVFPPEFTLYDNNDKPYFQRSYGALVVTQQQFFTASGRSTQREGVKADIVFPGGDKKPKGLEKDMEGAIPYKEIASRVPPEVLNDVKHKTDIIEVLKGQSKQRTGKDKRWDKVLRAAKDQKDEQADQDDAESKDPKAKEVDLYSEEAVNVLMDLLKINPATIKRAENSRPWGFLFHRR